ncbi:pentatricopeptide repeat-containing protein At4g21065 [Amborella trichopoda]|nr:pentatricopeptide repeat-containing protein At4g21065 [Amborella trichopoda]|eukprot:XP_020526010.1 pentatricopeptide repeat-containing protein At4g21065 [Amborella trichopoda]
MRKFTFFLFQPAPRPTHLSPQLHTLATKAPPKQNPLSLFTYNTLIMAKCSSPSSSLEGLELFVELHSMGLKPNRFTFPSTLKACSLSKNFRPGQQLHSLIVKHGFVSDLYTQNTLLTMYSHCSSSYVEALQVFDEMPERDVVSWTSMMACWAQAGELGSALRAFGLMLRAGVRPTRATLLSLFGACAQACFLPFGQALHAYTVHTFAPCLPLSTTLLEMYAKCGLIDEALKLYNGLGAESLQAWTAMVLALGIHGRGEEVLALFRETENDERKMDGKAFTAVLSACSHLGLVERGREYFERMEREYNVKRGMEHYGCMVDMYGRAGMVDEAYGVIMGMPMEPNPVILRSFMGACMAHGVGERLGFMGACMGHGVGEKVGRQLLEGEPSLGKNYVLVANVCARAGRWDLVEELRGEMREKGLKKVVGCSWVES